MISDDLAMGRLWKMYASFLNLSPSVEESLDFVEISNSRAQNAEEEGSGRGGVAGWAAYFS